MMRERSVAKQVKRSDARAKAMAVEVWCEGGEDGATGSSGQCPRSAGGIAWVVIF